MKILFRNSAIVLVILWLTPVMMAQFSAQQSMAAFESMGLNALWGGQYSALHVQIQHRLMWTGIQGAPETSQIHLSAPLLGDKLYGSLHAERDQIGLYSNMMYMAGSAYKLRLDKHKYMLFGLQMGLQQMVYRGDQTSATDMTDLSLNVERTQNILFQMGTGFLFRSPSTYVGISVPRMLSPSYIGGGKRHSKLTLGSYIYNFQIGHYWSLPQQWRLHTGALLKKPTGLNSQAEAYALLGQSIIQMGLGYRLHDSAQVLFEWRANAQLCIQYAYDHPTSRLRQARQGSHEWMLRYTFSYNNQAHSPKTL